MSLELLVFLIVAAVAIFSSAFMLASRNAVHSALFLVTTMICLAFFYLILNAPFLAMVQITVYAGAIMVLFLFVIMLLGSDKLDTPPTRYRWVSVGAIGLAALFLVTAFIAVVQGNVNALQPVPPPPQVRVLDAITSQPITVYADNTLVSANVAPGVPSDYVDVPVGVHTVEVYNAKADGSAIDPGKDKPIMGAPITSAAATTTTLVITPDQVIPAGEDLTPLDTDNQFRYVAVNALPGATTANLLQIDPNDASQFQVAAPHVSYGQASQPQALPAGAYTFTWEVNGVRTGFYPAGQTISAGQARLFVLAPDPNVKGQVAALQFDQQAQASFGSPQQMGEQLFSGYLLPFELVSLLLLAAMVGAIVLTREEVIRRERKRLVVSPHVARLNQATDALVIRPANSTPVNAEPNPESASD